QGNARRARLDRELGGSALRAAPPRAHPLALAHRLPRRRRDRNDVDLAARLRALRSLSAQRGGEWDDRRRVVYYGAVPPGKPSPAYGTAVLDAAPDGMFIVDAQGHILLANRQAHVMFGYGPSELTGVVVEALLPEALRAGHSAHRDAYV